MFKTILRIVKFFKIFFQNPLCDQIRKKEREILSAKNFLRNKGKAVLGNESNKKKKKL